MSAPGFLYPLHWEQTRLPGKRAIGGVPCVCAPCCSLFPALSHALLTPEPWLLQRFDVPGPQELVEVEEGCVSTSSMPHTSSVFIVSLNMRP